MKSEWKLIDDYPIKTYSCGLIAGQKVKLKKDIVVEDHAGKVTGIVHKAGEIWEVLSGSKEPPIVVWLRQPDGNRHTWGDDPSIFEHFEVIAG
jgi:hypothetical protein